jgi:hypothetical protein
MEFYAPRKLKFKAWNVEAKLLMRLNAIDCDKGELVKKDHILLQFTEMTDQHGEELYEMDVVLLGSEKSVIVWNHHPAGWNIVKTNQPNDRQVLTPPLARTFIRLCSYFELEKR